MNTDCRLLAVDGNEASLDSERAHRREHVAAIRRGIDEPLLHFHLGKKVVDICAFARRGTDDRHFGGKRVAAANSVDLQMMARSHDLDQQRVTFVGIDG
jgi:hypothetical protein